MLATTAGSQTSAMLSGGPSAPTPGPNINAAQISSIIANGFVPLLSTNGTQQFAVYTNEYTIDQTAFEPTSFSWYAASAYSGDQQRLILQIAGNWYASTSPVSPPSGVIQGTGFAAGSLQFTTLFSTSSTAWETLNFAPGTDLSLGMALTTPLPAGNITGFGIYAQIADSSGNTNERTFFDTFQVNASSVPEPAAGFALVVSAISAVRWRRSMKRSDRLGFSSASTKANARS